MGRNHDATGEVPAQSTVSPDNLPRGAEGSQPPTQPLVIGRDLTASPVGDRRAPVALSPEIEDTILERYEGGLSFSRIGAMEDMPTYQTILRRIRNNEEFRKKVEASRAVRALHFEEQALEVADPALSKDEVPAARLAFDANVWAAEVNDPTRYGKKTTIAGDRNNPIAFTILTGVPQPDDAKAIELNADGTVKSPVINVTPECQESDTTVEAAP